VLDQPSVPKRRSGHTRVATNKGADSGQNIPTGEDDDEVLEALQKQIREQTGMLKLLLANQEAQKAEISIMKEELALVKEENQRLHEKLDDIAALVHPEQPQTVICRSGPHRTDKLAKQRTDPHVFRSSRTRSIVQSTCHAWKKQATRFHLLQSVWWWNLEFAANENRLTATPGAWTIELDQKRMWQLGEQVCSYIATRLCHQ